MTDDIIEKQERIFQKQQLEKREKFHEKVHAAFILKTSFTDFGKITEHQMDWLGFTYPKSIVKTGTDQGARYFSIEPKF